MSIAFAACMGHAPGWVAWTERASEAQRTALAEGVDRLKGALGAAKPEALILLTSEHWANFFLDHMSAFCVGRGDVAHGPIEPWMKMPKTAIPGDPHLAGAIIEAAYAAGVEPSFAHELVLDHGSMVPLSFLTPKLDIPVVPIFFNTLAPPQPSPARCFQFGQVIGEVARASGKRIGLIATGGMSHDPGERGHGHIDTAFDHRFLELMKAGDVDALRRFSIADFAGAGVGAVELIAWVALAGALGKFTGEVLAYQAVEGWATGMGVMRLDLAA